MKERMFRLHRHKSYVKSGERIDFNFSNIQALQVPKGWDKLSVSIISIETGKTISKSGKASVWKGTCCWTETLSESIWIKQHDASKETEHCLFKLVVAMGSARSRILGEVTINLAGYMNPNTSGPTSLPLKKCDHGTIIKLEIQCKTPQTKYRDEKREDTDSCKEDMDVDYGDIDNTSDISDCTFTRSVGSSLSNHLDNTSHPQELGSRETSFSASGSSNSFDSIEGSLGREKFSPQNNLSGVVNNVIGRQDLAGFQDGTSGSPYPVPRSPRSNHSFNNSGITGSGWHLHNQRGDFGRIPRAIATSPLRYDGSSKNFLEVEEVSAEEHRAEARMWEQNARKLMLDLELMRKEFTDQSNYLADLEIGLSLSHTECDGLKQEIKHLKVVLDESMAKQKTIEDMKSNVKDMDGFQKEMEDEMKFQKETNYNLSLQLKKTQESNLELVSILQELEETIEKQKIEIENLSILKSKFDDIGTKYNCGHEEIREAIPCKEVSEEKMRKASCDLEHPITDLHSEFEPRDDPKFEAWLRRLQESHKNLESTILYLEKILQDRNHEIEIERDLKTKTILDCETEWGHKLAAKEQEIINLEAKLSKAFVGQDSKLMEFENTGDLHLVEEIAALKEKVQELERDCNELTDENLELLFKLKKTGKDVSASDVSFDHSSSECLTNDSPGASKSEVSFLKSQTCQPRQEMKKEILLEGVASNHLQIQCVDPESKNTSLELQLQTFKDKACSLDGEFCMSRAKTKEQEAEIVALWKQLELHQGKTVIKDDPVNVHVKFKNSELQTAISKYELLPALHEQLQFFFVHLKKQQYDLSSTENTECKCAFNNLNIEELITHKECPAVVLNYLIKINKLLEGSIAMAEDDLQCSEVEIRAGVFDDCGVQNKLHCDSLKENALVFNNQKPKISNEALESRIADLSNELLVKASKIEKLEAGHLLKEEEIEALKHHQMELEIQISDLHMTKHEMETNMKVMQRESSITSKCLDGSRNELVMLSRNMDSHISANKILERTSSELKSEKHELEVHLSELEEENVHLAERISGLEAQLRYLTDARESSRLELQHSESHIMKLQDEIRRLETEMEVHKIYMKQKLLGMQNRWLEALDECEYLKKANPKLQATAESLIEECTSLQKSNGELRQQKVELHKRCTGLEAELRESQDRFSDCSKKIEALEVKSSLMLDDIVSKEKTLNSELDNLLHRNKEHEEKILLGERLLNQIYMEKSVAIENLQLEVAHLTGQISVTHDEKERTASESVLKMHSLYADKCKLEAALQEFKEKFEQSERNLDIFQMECETKVQGLMGKLAASKENQEVLGANHDKLLGLLENFRSNEEKLRGTINELGSKLSSSEYERLQQAEEIYSLKIQLQKIPLLHDEVLASKSSLGEMKFENERLRTSLQLVTADYEELKTERNLFVQKISSMQKVTSELEDCRCSKVALEEKILRLEGDLMAREALCSQDAELKNELGRVRRANSQFQWKIKLLEEEKEECLKRAQALEEELKQEKEVEKDQMESCSKLFLVDPGSNATTTVDEELKLPKVDTNKSFKTVSFQGIEIERLSRIQYLENELAEALKANDMYRSNLKSLSSDGQNRQNAPDKLKDAMSRQENEQNAASMEAELRDISERYSHMSLKYAVVEAQREQLVMKLKAVTNGRIWTS